MLFLSCCRNCCAISGRSENNNESSTNIIPTLPDLRDLILKPESIQSSLDEKINNWQAALNELKDVESDILEKQPELKTILKEIRSSPWSYQKHENDTYSYYSSLVIRVVECEKLLPQQSDEEIGVLRKASSASSTEWLETESKLLANRTVSLLSSIWSRRLNGMNQTQGALVISRDSELQDLRLKPKWPDFLVDVTFDVLKVNKYGTKMRRTLKLTQHHVISIKAGAAVTKFYPFSAIAKIFLQNDTTVRVLLKNDKRNMYVSPIAPHILQQITTRVQVRQSLDDKFIDQKTSQLQGYSSQATAEIIKSISEENKMATEEMLVNFAHELKQKTLQQTNPSQNGIELKESDTSEPLPITTGGDSERVDEVGNPLHLEKADTIEGNEAFDLRPQSSKDPFMTPRLSNFNDNSPEYLIQDAVRRLIFDPNSAEGNTRRAFIQKFVSEPIENAEEDLLKVRHFIDGMHEYILNERAYQLAIVYDQAKQRGLAAKAVPIMENSPTQLNRRASLSTMKKGPKLATEEVDESLLVLISYLIFVVVEESVFTSGINQKLIQLLRAKSDYEEDEQVLLSRMNTFRHRTQEQWGIPNDFVSPLGWQTAIFILSNLESNNTPSVQLQVLTRAVKAIYSEFKHAVIAKLRAEGKSTEIFIAADDLVPIFIYVFCQTKLKHPLQNRELMWGLCHPDSLHGEGGYYLTVYESAMEFILNEPVEREAYIGEIDFEIGDDRRVSRSPRIKSTSVVNALLKIPGILAFKDRTASETTMQTTFQ